MKRIWDSNSTGPAGNGPPSGLHLGLRIPSGPGFHQALRRGWLDSSLRARKPPEVDLLQGVFRPLAPNTSELFVPLLCCSLCRKHSSSLFCSPRPRFPPGRVCTSRPGAQPSVPVLPKGLPGARPRARPSALAVPHASKKPCKFHIILPLFQMRKLRQR